MSVLYCITSELVCEWMHVYITVSCECTDVSLSFDSLWLVMITITDFLPRPDDIRCWRLERGVDFLHYCSSVVDAGRMPGTTRL